MRLTGISHRYRRGHRPALSSVTAAFNAATVAVLGPNGAGKSTLLRILTTALRPESGDFTVGGWSRSSGQVEAYRRFLGYMPQDLRVQPGYTCRDFLTYMAWLKQVPPSSAPDAVNGALSAMNLSDRADTKVKHLSGGLRQRLGLAQAIVNSPQVIVLDEPTVGLDPAERVRFREHVKRLPDGCVRVLATHLTDDVAALADEVLILHEGRVRFAGPIVDLCRMPREDITGEVVEAAYVELIGATE